MPKTPIWMCFEILQLKLKLKFEKKVFSFFNLYSSICQRSHKNCFIRLSFNWSILIHIQIGVFGIGSNRVTRFFRPLRPKPEPDQKSGANIWSHPINLKKIFDFQIQGFLNITAIYYLVLDKFLVATDAALFGASIYLFISKDTFLTLLKNWISKNNCSDTKLQFAETLWKKTHYHRLVEKCKWIFISVYGNISQLRLRMTN